MSVQVNGSSIRPWWIHHHYWAMVTMAILLTLPVDSRAVQAFVRKFLWWSTFQVRRSRMFPEGISVTRLLEWTPLCRYVELMYSATLRREFSHGQVCGPEQPACSCVVIKSGRNPQRLPDAHRGQ